MTELTVGRRSTVAKHDAPRPPEAELFDRDLDAVLEVVREVSQAFQSSDLRKIQHALSRAENLCDDGFPVIAEADLRASRRQATKREIAAQVALMLAGFPSAEKLSPAFTRLLAEDIGAAEPSRFAVEAACRRLRRTWIPSFGRNCPSVAEVLAELASQEERLDNAAYYAITWLPPQTEELRAHWERTRADHREGQLDVIRDKLRYGDSVAGWDPELVRQVRMERGETVVIDDEEPRD